MTTATRPWYEPDDLVIPENYANALNKGLETTTHPLLSKILIQRGFAQVDQALEYLNPEKYQMRSPGELPGMKTAVNRIKKAITGKEDICVWGDFDVDGQTSTALLVEAITMLGGHARYYIPHRATESHGVHIPSLSKIIDAGATLIITCDTGISAGDALKFAANRGIDVIVTDHHEPPAILPPALSLINSHFVAEDHPLHTLPGVGVAFKLAEALFEAYDRAEQVERFLDLAALGIVADVAVLQGDTRILALRGLEKLRNTHRAGLLALYTLAEIAPERITEEHIGYTIAPRLNALGRLSDANKGVEFLTTSDSNQAYLLAVELEGLNAERQLLSEQVFQSARSVISNNPAYLDYSILLLNNNAWPSGLVGIVASRLVELYGKPVLLISTPPGELGRGSARSIPGVNIIQAIEEQAPLLASFGGHVMAAGLAVTVENIDALRMGLSKSIERQTGKSLPISPLRIDAFANMDDLTVDFVTELARLGPFGMGNPQVVLAIKDLHLVGKRVIGRANEHLLMSVADLTDSTADVIWWQGANFPLPGERFDLAFTVRNSDYRGKSGIQLTWVAARDLIPAQLPTRAELAVELIDRRQSASPEKEFTKIIKEFPEALVWAEGGKSPSSHLAHRRSDLVPTSTLIIWTIPPSRITIRQVIESVKPDKVFLFCHDPNMDEPQTLLKRLSGLLKYAVNNYDGIIDLSLLAELCSHQEQSIKDCLNWLNYNTKFRVTQLPENRVKVDFDPQKTNEIMTSEESRMSYYKLQAALAETKAFRIYYKNAPVESLG